MTGRYTKHWFIGNHGGCAVVVNINNSLELSIRTHYRDILCVGVTVICFEVYIQYKTTEHSTLKANKRIDR